jgi:glycosyltransferase involved in cell wall biosynthesis
VEITLVTEGTYPHAYGGVSVWCDQLLRGMPEQRFTVAAITGTGGESAVWDVPAHVTVTTLPLWGPPPRGPALAGRAARRFEGLYCELVDSLLDDPDSPAEGFTEALRELYELSWSEAVEPALRSEDAVGWLMEAWAARREEFDRIGVTPTVHDAVTAVDLLEHALRPLFRPPPKADVTHAVTNGLAVLVGLAAKWTYGTPLIVTEHGVYLRERYLEYGQAPYSWPVKALMLNFLRRLCSAGYRAADLITPGNRYNQRWELRCGADADRLQTVYNGVDPTHFPPAGPEPAAPTISWAGRVDPIKDIETLIRAFALVRRDLPHARLRLFGGVPAGNEAYQDRCQSLISELGLTGTAAFEGRVDNILDAYAAGHVVALSSVSEGFPYTLIEAMTAGRATVSTDVGGVTEAVGATGLVVPPRDPAAMAAACVDLLRDDSLRHRLGASARLRALEYFTVEQAVDTFRLIYAELASAHGRQGRHDTNRPEQDAAS